jgi:hypothetical protein
MSTVKRLALIAAGYALCVFAGLAAVALNELRMSEDVMQGSPGMVAFGDMILFVLVAGFCGLVPTFFLLKLLLEKAPRALLAIVFLAAALGPVSWLAMLYMAHGANPSHPSVAIGQLLGLFIAFVAIPRIVLGPVMVGIEAVTFLLIRGRVVRRLLIAAMLMDVLPLGLFFLHMLHAVR